MFLEALLFAIGTIGSNLNDGDRKVFDNGMRLITRLHSVVEQAINNYSMKSWIHMPKSSYEFNVHNVLRGRYEGTAHVYTAGFLTRLYRGTNELTGEESSGRILRYYRKALTIFKLFDLKSHSFQVEERIADLNEELGLEEEDPKLIVARRRAAYDQCIQQEGGESEKAIRYGFDLGYALSMYNHITEAKQLVTKLAATCHRVHGREHDLTTKAEELLNSFEMDR